ncbi:hypothetical protein TSUD_297540 [Trifolium subterraneum]|uniref:RNase H type-1 domain-containing protein n=1 Tax=Trifolium subterraneum TaxID=3900 RepID=A0A2Z6MVK4_TRISU|nr:hypothetical protein TSUD_297540 [Trifolium subterraneum]
MQILKMRVSLSLSSLAKPSGMPKSQTTSNHRIYQPPEHLRHKLLSGTFNDTALRWYMNLPKNSIENYADFHKKFIHQFSGTKHIKVTATSLFIIRQNYAETLREYLARFSEATIKVSNPNHEMFVAAFHNGLKTVDFNESLAQKPAASICKGHDTERCFRLRDLIDDLIRSGHLRKFLEDTAKGQIALPKEVPYPPKGEGDGGNKGEKHRVAVNTISGGFVGEGESNSSRKRYVRRSRFEKCSVGNSTFPHTPEISFNAEDGRDVAPHDDDPLVVQVQILNCDVKRVLIYLGSSADILYWDAFKAMRLSYEQLKPYYGSLVGFAGEQVDVMGHITLYTTFGEWENAYLVIGEEPHQTNNIGTSLKPAEKESIITILCNNRDLFAWQPSDMPGIDESVITHKLSISSTTKPVVQRKRKVGEERRAAIMEEVAKLKETGFIEEIKYPTWLANMVMVKKANGKWRMCVDFTDLNKACPKDPYPLPNIDRLIDGASGYKTLSFMDAYSGYNQIKMNPMDAQHTAFMSNTCNYFYNIGKNLEVYIDDMVVKTEEEDEHDKDLGDILKSVRKYNMRLNPTKCSFGVQAGKFLAFLLTHRGIEANPDKCEKACHFFATLRKSERFTWSPQCEEVFQKLKVFLDSPLILTRPGQGKILYLYLAVSERALNSALVQEIEGEEKPIYFLRQYFQSHQVVVKTDYPIKNVLRKPDLAGRMVEWSVEFSEFDITYTPRGAIKSQAMADFVLELTDPPSENDPQPWTLSVDGSSNLRGSGAGVVLEGPEGVLIEQSLRFSFKESNNQAEYGALIAVMKLAKETDVQELKAQSDSQLVAKDPQLAKYLEKVKEMVKHFAMFELAYVPMEQNSRADLLAKLASTKNPDILGPLPTSTAQAKWTIVAVDYFTKWVEAEPENNAALEESLDLLPELREKAHFKEFYTKQRAARKYNTRVIPRKFKEGDLVLKRPISRGKGGKMAANWEGPFRIHEAFEGGAYMLETMEGEVMPRTWNIANLRFYYS